MIFYLPNIITSYSLYHELIPQLTKYYVDGNKENPTLSFVKTEKMKMESVPVFMGILNVIYNVNHKPTYLDFIYNPYLLYFLEHSLFLSYADTLGYIIYDKELIGGFSDYIEKEYRSAHVVRVYSPIENYFELSEDEQVDFRSTVYEEMRYHIVPRDYGCVLNDISQLWQDEMENFKTLLAELITNAQLYSTSKCFSFFCSDKYKSIISICDVGNGFDYSLSKKRGKKTYPTENVNEFNKIKSKCIQKYKIYKLDSFFNIMESLFYSQLQNRINLAKLKKMIIDSNGILRIQTGNVQVIFTKHCRECKNGIEECINCLLERSSYELKYSPVKFYESSFKGVRIEIAFERR